MTTAIKVDFSRRIEITEAQRKQISSYFKSIKPWAYSPGRVYDKFTDTRPLTKASYMDDNFSWSNELVYYFEKYGIVPPNEFLEKTFGWTV